MFSSAIELWNESKYHRSNEYDTSARCVCDDKESNLSEKSSWFLFSVRSLKLSTVRLLIANSADPNIANNRGETAAAIARYLPSDQQENFVNALAREDK